MNATTKTIKRTEDGIPIVGYDLPMLLTRTKHRLYVSTRNMKLSADKNAVTINRILNTNIICLDLYTYIHREFAQHPNFKLNTDKKLNTVLKSLGLPLKDDITIKELFDA